MATFKKIIRYVLFFFPYGPPLGLLLVYILGDKVNSLFVKIVIFVVVSAIPLYLGIKGKMYLEIMRDSKKVAEFVKAAIRRKPK